VFPRSLCAQGELSATRRALVDRAFARLDADGDGRVNIHDVRALYSAAAHPLVIQGIKTEDEVRSPYRFLLSPRSLPASLPAPRRLSHSLLSQFCFPTAIPRPRALNLRRQVLLEFLDTFEVDGQRDDVVTRDEFLAYYSALSASIDDDRSSSVPSPARSRPFSGLSF